MQDTYSRDNQKKSLNGQGFSFLHRLGKNLNTFISNLRKFCYLNNAVIEFVFIVIYMLEQLFLIVITYYFRDTDIIVLAVSIFALIVLSTFSAHKLVMQSRIKYLDEELHKYMKSYDIIVQKSEYLAKAHSDTVAMLRKIYLSNDSKTLNTTDDKKKGKGVKNE